MALDCKKASSNKLRILLIIISIFQKSSTCISHKIFVLDFISCSTCKLLFTYCEILLYYSLTKYDLQWTKYIPLQNVCNSEISVWFLLKGYKNLRCMLILQHTRKYPGWIIFKGLWLHIYCIVKKQKESIVLN